MPKKRRKLNPELEKNISLAKKEVELITAKIHDIYEEDIQDEYKQAFIKVVSVYMALDQSYKKIGFNEQVLALYTDYNIKLESFKCEYEI